MNGRCDRTKLRVAAIGMLLAVLPSADLRGAEADPDDAAAIAAAADGLRNAARFPWYDADGDQTRPLTLPPYTSPRQPTDWQWQAPQTGSPNWRWLWDLLWYAAWGLLIVTLGLLLLFLLRGLARVLLPSELDEDEAEARRVTEADRMEKLPFPVKRPQADLLGEARWHYEQGNFGEAIIYLFSYQLVQLDTHHLIRLAKGKTNRQYLRDISANSSLRAILRQTMLTFEEVFFGHYELSRERFEACWRRLDEFHAWVAAARGSETETPLPEPPSQPAAHSALTRCLLLLLLLLWSGCQTAPELSEEYGRRRGNDRGQSVNGTAVLAHMFAQAGYRVSSWRRLSPKLDHEQVIVWAPDDYSAPTDDEIDYLENWLANVSDDGLGNARTLVYIGRDYEAAVDYWRELLPRAAAAQRLEIRRELADVRSRHHLERSPTRLPETSCRWFTLEPAAAPTAVETLEGPWSYDLEPARTRLHLSTRLLPGAYADDSTTPPPPADEPEYSESSRHFEALLTSNDQIVVGRVFSDYWNGGQIIVVANGSFLLNLPLVNHEHRKLAGRLLRACGPPGRVCFLESGPGRLAISDSDSQLPLMLRAFTVWPVNAILLHLTMLGILFCFCVFPIFGSARRLPADSTADFGKHVSAVGDLLERGRDAAYAQQRVQQYQDLIRSN